MLFIIASTFCFLVSCAPLEDAKGKYVKLNQGAVVPPIIDAVIPTAKGNQVQPQVGILVNPLGKGNIQGPPAKGNQVEPQVGILVNPLGKGNIQGPPAGQCTAIGISKMVKH